MRLRQSLVSERSSWLHRVSAVIFHQGARLQNPLNKEKGRKEAQELDLSPAACELIAIANAMVRALDAQIEPLERELRAYANSQPACQALQGHFGIGPVLSVAIFAEIGDARRFSSSRKLVRLSGLDVTVYESADYDRGALAVMEMMIRWTSALRKSAILPCIKRSACWLSTSRRHAAPSRPPGINRR